MWIWSIVHRVKEFTYPHKMWTFTKSVLLTINVHISEYECPQTMFAGLWLFSCLCSTWLDLLIWFQSKGKCCKFMSIKSTMKQCNKLSWKLANMTLTFDKIFCMSKIYIFLTLYQVVLKETARKGQITYQHLFLLQ